MDRSLNRRMVILAACGLVSLASMADEPAKPRCAMQPTVYSMTIPKAGFVWAPGEDSKGECLMKFGSPVEWEKAPAGNMLYVQAEGPGGSGHYWSLVVGVSDVADQPPQRGLCLVPSTVGWRTLGRYPTWFAWLKDADGDGQAEFIEWSGFGLHEDASLSEIGLVGWVYRLKAPDQFELDLPLSRRLAKMLADEYADQPPESTSRRRPRTDRVAGGLLRKFAEDGCRIVKNAGKK